MDENPVSIKSEFRNELLRQPEDEAQDLALSLEIFTTGSLDAFAHQSDVNVNNRIVAYDILELGEQMKSIGLLIMKPCVHSALCP